MKILLTAINAKYIHSNLAVYSLRANAGRYKSYVTLKEYTINHLRQEVITGIYKEAPDVLVLSCYIWNIEFIKSILEDIRQILPKVDIWLGGPEVSYLSQEFLSENPAVKGIMRGEGEITFRELVGYYVDNSLDLKDICGLTYRDEQMKFVTTRDRELCHLDELTFAYEDLRDFDHRIIYYESSRGCPYSCAYCLSSVDKTVRFRSLSLVEQELDFFLEHKVPQVKFVDRTFNCSHNHTMGILKYIKEHDNGVTNFHFEVSADILNEEELSFLRGLRPGLVQLEIGVQSVNPNTIAAIQRRTRFDVLKKNVLYLKEKGNIHQHLDLIAGLPKEDYESFGHSFDAVYELRPQQLQLGFLKVLKGAYLYDKKEEFGIVYSKTPPYEVLYTRWLSYGDVIRLKQVEEMVEIYYNSGQFTRTMEFLETFFSSAFAMYESLGDYYECHGLFARNHSRMTRYDILLSYFQEKFCGKETQERERRWQECLKECLLYDLYLRENLKNRPLWAPSQEEDKENIRLFYRREALKPKYLLGETYEKAEEKQLYRMTHLEVFSYDVQGDFQRKRTALLFDYEHRSPLSHEAAVHKVDETQEKF